MAVSIASGEVSRPRKGMDWILGRVTVTGKCTGRGGDTVET